MKIEKIPDDAVLIPGTKDEYIDRQGNVYGSKNNFAKLTEEQVLEIRKTHIKGVGSRKGNTKELANKYGVSTTLINQISRKDIWKHLEER